MKKTQLAVTGLLSAALIGGGIYFSDRRISLSQKTEANVRNTILENLTLEDARSNVDLRQKFLDGLLKNDTIPFCAGVHYDHDGSKIMDYFQKQVTRAKAPRQEDYQAIGGSLESFRGGNYDIKVPSILQFTSNQEYSPIFLGRRPFEGREFSYMTQEDLRAVIVAHEGRHVMQHAQGSPFLDKAQIQDGVENGKIRGQVLYAAYEYDANMQELPRLLRGEFNVSEHHLNEVKFRYMTIGLFLNKSASKGSELEKQIVEKLNIKSFQEPLLRNISIPSEFHQQRLKFSPQ